MRFTPDAQAPGAGGSGSAGGLVSKLLPRPPGMGGRRTNGGAARENSGGSGRIWVLQNGQPVAITVQKGVSDGRQTEVAGPGLTEGLAVITDQTVGDGRG